MGCVNLQIQIENEEISEHRDLMSIEVELDDELAAMFRLRLATGADRDGQWQYLDEDSFRVWKQVTITAGFESGSEELISGYVTHVRPYFDPDPGQCYLEIWGIDQSVVMDRQEKLKDWASKKDSDIASEILASHGFTPQVEDTEVTHDEAVSSVIQRETDMQFLKRLALRNGFECWVEGTTGYFGPPQIDADPEPLLAVHFGDETTVGRFSVEVNALAPANVAMFQLDRTSKEVLEATAESSRLTPLGEIDAAGLPAAGIEPGQVVIAGNAATGSPEMTALCQGLFHRGEWFVTGEGEINGNLYGHLLKPRRTVTVKGVGESYSGVYYVTHVTHTFAPEGYTQLFRVKRNAVLPTGSEDFSASSEGLV